ncbi:MAG: ShlB/FhaC/HecB family hemolysin secretion/activation protein [Desulfobacterales bacterium]
MIRRILQILITVVCVSLLAIAPAAAQTPPDAGRILEEIEPDQVRPTEPSEDIETEEPAPAEEGEEGEATVQLESIVFEGNTVFSDAVLQETLPDDLFTEPRDLGGLRALARTVTRHYREAGYPFAMAFVPAQKLEEGKLTIRVLEGRYGRVTTEGEDEKLTKFADDFLTPLQPGEVIDGPELERTTLILGDQPGVSIRPVLAPGEETGTGDLRVGVSEAQRVTGGVSVDNHGNRYSGEWRTRANLGINRLLIPGDQLQIEGLYTEEDMWLGGLRYGAPLGSSGLRGHARYARTEYDLKSPFEGFIGTTDIAEAGAIYPLIRSQQLNLDLTASYRFKDLSNEVQGFEYDARKIHSLPVGLRFDNRDELAGGGITFGSLTLTPGRVDADVGGGLDSGFTKVEGQVARQQRLPGNLQVFARLQGQWTDVPVPSAEAMSLGGARGVRAYPQGEGTGSRGILMRTELRRPFTELPAGRWTPFTFFDAGGIQGWKDESSRSIAGGGLGLRWLLDGWQAEVATAWKSNGGDPRSDSKSRSPRAWFELGYRF